MAKDADVGNLLSSYGKDPLAASKALAVPQHLRWSLDQDFTRIPISIGTGESGCVINAKRRMARGGNAPKAKAKSGAAFRQEPHEAAIKAAARTQEAIQPGGHIGQPAAEDKEVSMAYERDVALLREKLAKPLSELYSSMSSTEFKLPRLTFNYISDAETEYGKHAHYDSKNNLIELGPNYFESYKAMKAAEASGDREAAQSATLAIVRTMGHEIGHAILTQLSLNEPGSGIPGMTGLTMPLHEAAADSIGFYAVGAYSNTPRENKVIAGMLLLNTSGFAMHRIGELKARVDSQEAEVASAGYSAASFTAGKEALDKEQVPNYFILSNYLYPQIYMSQLLSENLSAPLMRVIAGAFEDPARQQSFRKEMSMTELTRLRAAMDIQKQVSAVLAERAPDSPKEERMAFASSVATINMQVAELEMLASAANARFRALYASETAAFRES